jgi:membrane protease YdiL (CAAX protease family)
MDERATPSVKRLRSYFAISHGLPLFVTIIAMTLAGSLYISDSLLGTLVYVGMASPLFAVLYVLYRHYGPDERRAYGKSIVDVRRISLRWWAFVIAFPILIRFVASLLDANLVLSEVTFHLSPEMTLPYAVTLLFFGPIHEELGWRGIALPELEKRYGFVVAVLGLGFLWAIWHLPVFFVEGTYQHQLGLFTPLFWSFMLGVLFTSVVYGAIYFGTDRSILAVILFHYIGNLAGETFEMTTDAELISTVLRGIVAVLIVIYYMKYRKNASQYRQ